MDTLKVLAAPVKGEVSVVSVELADEGEDISELVVDVIVDPPFPPLPLLTKDVASGVKLDGPECMVTVSPPGVTEPPGDPEHFEQ